MGNSSIALAWLCSTLPLGAQDAEEKRGLLLATDRATPGFVLFAPLRSTTTYLIDGTGEVVHEWKSGYRPGNSVYLLPDGNLLRMGRMENEHMHGGGQGGRLQLLGWTGDVLWDIEWANAERMAHHDVEPLPNGNVLVLSWEMRSFDEAVAAGRDPAATSKEGFWPDSVFEIEPLPPDGFSIVWEWHVWDHLIQDFDPEQAHYGDVTAHPERVDVNVDHRDDVPLTQAERERQAELQREMQALGYLGEDDDEGTAESGDGPEKRGDWLHTNGIDFEPELDLILLSVRRCSEVWVIDHSTTTEEAAGRAGGRYGKGGDLLYRWGNPRTYGAGDEAARRLFLQHDGSWIRGTDGSPRILVFNNGEGRPGGNSSSVDEIAPPFERASGFAAASPGEPFLPSEPIWSYGDPPAFFSSFISGAQRLTNGNTFVCEGAKGRLFEVTSAGEVLWEYLNPFGEDPEKGPEPRGGDAGQSVAGQSGPDRGRPGRRGGPNMHRGGLFRGTHLPPDHPGLVGREL